MNLDRWIPECVKIQGIRARHINRPIQTRGFVVDKSKGHFYLQDITWIKNIKVLDAPLWVNPDPVSPTSYCLKCVSDCASVSLGDRVVVARTLRVGRTPIKIDRLFSPYDGELYPEMSSVFDKFLEVYHIKLAEKSGLATRGSG